MIKIIVMRFYLFSKVWFGLKPFLCPYYSYRGVTEKRMKLGYWINVKYRFIMLSRWLKCDHELFNKMECQLQEKAVRRLSRQFKKSKHQKPIEQPLPEVSADVDPKLFFKKFVKHPHPVVIRGLASDLEAVKKWNKSYFEAHFGDTKVQADTIKYDIKKSHIEFDENFCTLKEAINTPGVYLNASRDVFNANPQLEDDISDILAWKKYLRKADLMMSQAFLGLQAEGAPFHCANAWNFFIMIEGEKEWTFIDPEYTFQVGAVVHPTVISVEGCATGKGATWRDAHPLFSEYCPKFKTIVRQGDVILNPPWWWHEIKNLSSFSIGVSSRWLVYRYVATNRFFDLLTCLSSPMWKMQQQVFQLLGKSGEQKRTEEDLLRRLVNRKLPGKEKYFEDFLNRSKQKVF